MTAEPRRHAIAGSKPSWARVLVTALTALLVLAAAPPPARAHGPLNPAASSFLARVTAVPRGLHATAVDGDQRLWLQVDPSLTVVVLDYQGAPYLRFSRAGVEVNQNSPMYYLNQTPTEIPPTTLGPDTESRWSIVSSGHSYEWHDGRLHALATTVIAPGRRDLGRWTVALTVAGRRQEIAGTLRYAPDPSLVWFWPIIVVLACVLAGLRLRRPELDWAMARGLAIAALIGLGVAVVGRQLHGRPTVGVVQILLLAVELALVAWGLIRVASGRHGWFTYFLIAAAAIYQGVTLVTVLVRGFVLLATPALLTRLAVASCLAAGVGLVPLLFRLAPAPDPGADAGDAHDEDELALGERNLPA